MADLQKQVVRRFLVLCALIGLVTQVVQVLLQYFAFSTTTMVAFTIPKYAERHSVAICIRYWNIIDYDRLSKDVNQKVGVKKRLSDRLAAEEMLTVAQVFNYTPDPVFTIHHCAYRPDRWKLERADHRECNQVFSVSKFFMQEFMCYKIAPVDKSIKLFFEAATRSTFGTGQMWLLWNLVRSFLPVHPVSKIILGEEEEPDTCTSNKRLKCKQNETDNTAVRPSCCIVCSFVKKSRFTCIMQLVTCLI